jgi:hypothetical protein
LTSLLYFVFFVVPLFETFCDAPASTGLGTSTLETEGVERASPLLVSPLGGVSFDAVSEELWDRDAEEALAGTADLEEEKK